MRIITPINVTGPTTFTRASTATYVTKAGLLATAAVNELRPYYLPPEAHLLGVLLEPAATNLMLRSEDCTVAPWAATISGTSTRTNVAGTTGFGLLQAVATSANGGLRQQITSLVAAQRYALSFYLESATATVLVTFENGTSAFGSPHSVVIVPATGATSSLVGFTVTSYAWGAGRVYNLITQPAASGAIANIEWRIPTNGGTILLGRPQFEAGASATSYIPTVASSVTRAADVMTGTGLAFSNVPENDYPQWSAGTYTLGTRRLYLRKVYEVIVASTTDNPATGAALTVPSWLLIGSENRYKMFDQTISTQTAQATSIEAAVTPGGIVNAVAFFGLSGNRVTVTVDDLSEGVVYDTTKSLQDYTSIVDWYAYFFDDIVQRTDIVFLDLPSYGSATLAFTIEGLAAECGEVVFGRQKILGVSNYGTSISIQDYSIKSRDAFGNTIITQRAFSKRADYDVTVETAAVSAVQQALAAIRTTPTVFVGEEAKAETIVYGFYRAFNIVLANPSVSDCTIEVEGLV